MCLGTSSLSTNLLFALLQSRQEVCIVQGRGLELEERRQRINDSHLVCYTQGGENGWKPVLACGMKKRSFSRNENGGKILDQIGGRRHGQ